VSANFLGIEIGGTKLQLFLSDAEGAILTRHQYAVAASRGADGIRKQLAAAISKVVEGTKLAAVGVGFGGPVDYKTGKICRSHQIEGWSEFDLRGWLAELTSADVFVENDANVAALGEALRGAGRKYTPVFYVTLGSGVGGGLVLDGRIYHGALPGEAEIGHVRLDRSGGTVESRCSGWAVDARIRTAVQSNADSELARLCQCEQGVEARHLATALMKGDRVAQQILSEVAGDLAFGLSHVVHLYHPEIIILGGGLAKLGEPLRAAVSGYLGRHVMEVFVPTINVALAELQEDAVPVGALEICRARAGSRLAT
jgi:glucokinase